jgi:hypothetical protein
MRRAASGVPWDRAGSLRNRSSFLGRRLKGGSPSLPGFVFKSQRVSERYTFHHFLGTLKVPWNLRPHRQSAPRSMRSRIIGSPRPSPCAGFAGRGPRPVRSGSKYDPLPEQAWCSPPLPASLEADIFSRFPVSGRRNDAKTHTLHPFVAGSNLFSPRRIFRR